MKNFTPKITKEEFERTGPHYCECIDNCGQLIEWKNCYRYEGIPKYKHGHGCSKQKIVVTKEEFDRTAPHYCQCEGKCGQEILWQERYRRTGIPKYKNGHFSTGKNNPMYGKSISSEHKERLSESHKGQIPWNKGKHLPPEICNKISIGHTGKKFTEEHIKNRVDSYRGYKHTQEAKIKMSSSQKRRFLNKENHPSWKGGISYLPYCKLFNKSLKEAVRNRDNRLCQLCNKTEEENKEKQTVHHIHYDKENCEPDLITLCRSCNSKVNINRDYYEKLFMNMLNDRKLLFWIKEYSTNEKNVLSIPFTV